jgi:hypothetical protein
VKCRPLSARNFGFHPCSSVPWSRDIVGSLFSLAKSVKRQLPKGLHI